MLAGVALAQAAVSVLGRSVALDRRLAYDLPVSSGRPEDVRRDSYLMGTALSPPVPMIVLQAVAAIAVARGPAPWAEKLLPRLGRTMVTGYLGEREVRRVLRRDGWDPVESPVAAAGLVLAAAMSVLAPPR